MTPLHVPTQGVIKPTESILCEKKPILASATMLSRIAMGSRATHADKADISTECLSGGANMVVR